MGAAPWCQPPRLQRNMGTLRPPSLHAPCWMPQAERSCTSAGLNRRSSAKWRRPSTYKDNKGGHLERHARHLWQLRNVAQVGVVLLLELLRKWVGWKAFTRFRMAVEESTNCH